MKKIYDQKGLYRYSIQNFRLIRIARNMLVLILLASVQLINVDAAVMQPETVTGTVIDDAGIALPGVYITIKGTTRGAMTDAEGKYSIEVEGTDAVLEFSFILFVIIRITPVIRHARNFGYVRSIACMFFAMIVAGIFQMILPAPIVAAVLDG